VEKCGDTAWCRTHLAIAITPPQGKAVRRSGYTLSVLRKSGNGKWQLFRDANLLTPEPD
jgi:ketosteroid isomerase-like protein